MGLYLTYSMGMANKATHTGTCQCCGATQKLPGNVLSKHGYTVDWGFFNGVCAGAHCPPFELSCDLIKGFIESAKGQLARLEAEQIKWGQPATEPKAWVHVYHGSTRKGANYRWHYLPIHRIEKPWRDGTGSSISYEYDLPTGCREFQLVSQPGRGLLDQYNIERDLLAFCLIQNARYAASFDKKIAAVKQYIGWQADRIKGWKPEPDKLKLIK